MNRLMAFLLTILWGFLGLMSPAWGVTEGELQEINQRWQSSVHALNDINCSSCHQDRQTKAVVSQPNHESCRSCHEQAVETFLLGKHGIRLQEEQTPLNPAMAHLPMKPEAANKVMNCNTCHDVHSVNTVQASVDSCLSCHNDDHSLNYQKSKHGQLFASKAKTLPRPDAESVTCATCHLPRQPSDGESATVLVNHNNTFTLLPRDRMVKEVCMNCHGMEYSFNNIFDDEVVEADFKHPTTQDLQTLKMMRVFQKLKSPKSSELEATEER